MFNFTKTDIDWLIIVEPQIFWDERWFFMETYSKKEFQNAGIDCDFVQDNHSKSKAWVLRGLHFQTQNTQAKLVRVISWRVYDVAVDLRKDSNSYWKWFGIVLSAENKKQLFIPQWFAHGFVTLEDNTEFVYKCDNYYMPENEGGIIYNDSTLAIDWTQHYNGELFISKKDTENVSFEEFDTPNIF